MMRVIILRPLVVLLFGMIIGIKLSWFFSGFLLAFIGCLYLKAKEIRPLFAGLVLGALSMTVFGRVESQNPSLMIGNVEIRSFGDYRKGVTTADVAKDGLRSKIIIEGQVPLAPGDRLDVQSIEPGERKKSFKAKTYEFRSYSFLHSVAAVRISALRRLEEMYGGKNGSWVQSLTLNFPANLESEDKQALQLSGTYHLVSASGLHVVIVAVALQSILLIIGIPRHHLIWIIFVTLLFYCGITGLQAATVRASLMWLIASSAHVFRRSPDGLSALALAGVFWLALDPDAIYSISFQLSFTVTAALVMWYERSLVEIPSWRRVIEGSVIAFLASEPICAWWFGKVVFSGLITNVLIELPSSGILILGLLSLLPWIGSFFALLCTPLISYLQVVTSWCGALPYLTVYRQSTPLWMLTVYYLLLLLLLSKRKPRLSK